MSKQPLRKIPAVEKLLQALGDTPLPRPMLVGLVRQQLASLRKSRNVPEFDAVVASIRASALALDRAKIRPVINGTGTIIHTNLGRSPLGVKVLETLKAIGGSYNNLEYDLNAGERGRRAEWVEQGLAILSGAEAATISNNCAAALVLILRHFTRSKPEVVISRGELVQIGGGFKIPEVLESSGAVLREVGTTNRTSISDYTKAINPKTAMILKVHRSNFYVGGFVEDTATEDLAALARKKRVPLVEDLGSGAMSPTEAMGGLDHEPTPQEILRRGVDLVCFSGDKLLGGPQAGIIAGKSRHVAALKREPFFRALRCDKLVLAALQCTVESYLQGTAHKDVPILERLSESSDELMRRAQIIIAGLNGAASKIKIIEARAQVGGGTLPKSSIPSVAISITPNSIPIAELGRRLRTGCPPVIGTTSSGAFQINLRSVFPHEDQALVTALHAALS